MIDEINRDVEDGIWDIEFDRTFRSYEGMTIVINTRFITSIRITSSGEIETDGEYVMQKANLNCDGFRVSISAELIVVEGLNMSITGSGENGDQWEMQ